MSKTAGSDLKNSLYCRFCSKSQQEVRKLIAGPTVFICDECCAGSEQSIDQTVSLSTVSGTP